jgi:hypothetical protein
MSKKVLYILIALIVIVAGIFLLIGSGNNSQADVINQSQLIFYYGNTCPHCAKVESFFKDSNMAAKILFQQKEVYKNRNNAAELQTRATACGLPTDQIGVPFLWDGTNTKCLVGDQDIINFFKLATEGK